MLNDRQMTSINAKRQAAGKRPIDTQTARQNPNLPISTNVDEFWFNYTMPGDPHPDAKVEPSLPRDTYAAGVDGKPHGQAPEDKPETKEPVKETKQQIEDKKPAYEDMTIDQLKDEAEARDLDAAGVKLKADWIALLETDDKAQAAK